MIESRRRRVEELFQHAADLPAGRRDAFLQHECGDDVLLRREVSDLLGAMDDSGLVGLDAVDRLDEEYGELVGDHIGPYKLVRLIGEGGFGAVYQAEQTEPVRRQVALKIIKLGMDTRQVIARFEAERQALAMMDHPHIAHVLDAGATETGRPYFVMELVPGVPITEHCDEARLTPRQRLELFIPVCHAVQHAHQKGIVHRDIKPSNVLVTVNDGQAVPKVIDFGISKAMGQRLTDKTLVTELLQFIGTPEYMSPEQAEMSGLDIDTRTDIYSLGVLLYELLTGTTPFDAVTLRGVSFGEVQRIIREQDPPTPSRRLSTLGLRLRDVAIRRRSEPAILGRQVRGELDWIVMKALEKDRTRRYQTPAALAADVHRHLSNEAVEAGPPSRLYRARKFVQRNRVAVLAGTMVVAALLAGLGLATAGLVRARAEAASAQAINAFFNQMLLSVDPLQMHLMSAFASEQPVPWADSGVAEQNVSVAEMVQRASTKIDEAFVGKPVLEATARETIGMTLRGLGRLSEAEPQLTRALEIRRRELGAAHVDTLRAALALGDLHYETGRLPQAEPLVREAYEGFKHAFGEDHARTLSCAASLAAVLSDLGLHDEADKLFTRTLARQREVLGPQHRDVLVTLWRWSVSYLVIQRLADGQALARELYDLSEQTLAPSDSLRVLSKPLLGWWYVAQYRYAEGEELLRAGLEQCQRILGERHPFTFMTMHGLARALEGRKRADETEQWYRAALAGLRDTRGPLHWQTLSTTLSFARWLDHRGALAEAEELYLAVLADAWQAVGDQDDYTLSILSRLAEFYERTGQFDLSIDRRRERMRLIAERYKENSMQDWWEHDTLAQALVRMGRFEEARKVTRALLNVTRSLADQMPDDWSYLNTYAWTLLTCSPADLRDPERALPIAEKAVALSKGESSPVLDTLALAQHLAGRNDLAIETQQRSLKLLPEKESMGINYSAALIRYLLAANQTAAVERLVLEAVERHRRALGADNPRLADEFNYIGVWLAREGHYALAEAVLREALALNRALLGDQHEHVADTLRNLADAYYLQGKYTEAAESCREALELRRELLGEAHLQVARTLHCWGRTLYANGNPDGAAKALREAHATYERLDALGMPEALSAARDLAHTLAVLEQLEEAEPLARRTLEAHQQLFGDEHAATGRAQETLGLCLVMRGQAAHAEPLLEGAVAILSRPDAKDGERWVQAEAEAVLAQCLRAQERLADAEPLLLRSIEKLRQTRGNQHPDTRRALEQAVDLYEAWDKPAEALRWRELLIQR